MSADKLTPAQRRSEDNAALNRYIGEFQTTFLEVLDRCGVCSFLGKIAWVSTERGECDHHSVTPDEGAFFS